MHANWLACIHAMYIPVPGTGFVFERIAIISCTVSLTTELSKSKYHLQRSLDCDVNMDSLVSWFPEGLKPFGCLSLIYSNWCMMLPFVNWIYRGFVLATSCNWLAQLESVPTNFASERCPHVVSATLLCSSWFCMVVAARSSLPMVQSRSEVVPRYLLSSRKLQLCSCWKWYDSLGRVAGIDRSNVWMTELWRQRL